MKHGIKDKMKIFVLVMCMIAELLYFLLMALMVVMFLIEPDERIPVSAMIIMLIHAAILVSISIGGILRVKNGKRTVLIPGFLMKMLTACFGLGFIFMIAGIRVAAVFMLILSGVVGVFCVAICKTISANNVKLSVTTNVENENQGNLPFRCDKAELSWDLAAAEYCKRYNIQLEDLAEYEKDKIFEYAATPMAYFLAWLLKNDFMNEGFRLKYNRYLVEMNVVMFKNGRNEAFESYGLFE